MAIGEKVDFLFRKVDGSFDVNTQADQFLGQVIHTQGKNTLQRAQRIACCLCRTCLDQVSNGLGLSKIELVIEKRTLAEFTRTRQAAAQLQAALQQHIQNDRPTMTLKFQHVLASERVWPGEIQRNAFIEHLPRLVGKGAIVRESWLGHSTGDGLRGLAGQRPGHTDNTDTAAPLGGSDGGDGFTRNVHGPAPGQMTDSKTPH
ncbi:L-lysine 2,3-aminomutase [Pseudomonas syringae pv. actinidiae]|uniref:L-lysine 2,3-aminomutase n=1 Tax=Pseudomonas syringae pv. actinidiae TaxID=103796 RepID=A0A2V0QMK1_PSESF|nr:L-lysine 2,3-aminomutase [Pseudomonas syringae pv. actinidiae]